MRIRILDGCVGTDGAPWAAGDVRDVSEAFANELVSYHRAEILGAETPAPAPDPSVIANHAAETTVRDPAPAPSRKRGTHR